MSDWNEDVVGLASGDKAGKGGKGGNIYEQIMA